GGHRFPAFVNLQQYYAEEWLVERAGALGRTDIRWRHEVVGATVGPDRITLRIKTPDGSYRLTCDYLLACDGAQSMGRRARDLPFEGEAFGENVLIADVTMRSNLPAERWFWFDPPFNPNRSALLHRQPDDMWRIDLQLDQDADPDA